LAVAVAEINTAEPGTVAYACTLTSARRMCAVASTRLSREGAKKLAVVTKIAGGRADLAEMYSALALGEQPESAQPSKMIVKPSPT
jgi:phosphoribosylcarboxyaminoimidazole (NCAIR) mutase